MLFVDVHEDVYLPHQSPTGEAADMELALALGLKVPDLIWKAAGSKLLIDPSNVCMLGPRDERILQKTNVKSLDRIIEYYDDAALRKGTIENISAKGITAVDSKGRKIVAAP